MISFEGKDIPVEPGQTVAAALLRAGLRSWRRTRREGAPRGLFCGIGACFDCLASVNGGPPERICVRPAADGDVVSVAGTGDTVAGTGDTVAGTGDTRVGAWEVAVVGAGPAGMAAARRAAAAGRRVVVLDAGQRPGGQYWRHREPPKDRRYRELAGALDGVDYRPNATVWFAEPGFVLHTNEGVVRAERIVLATGAFDRVVPFPGWDLPGVVTAGGAQAVLKGSGVLVGRRIVVAGTGPFLLPVAANLATAGATVLGVFEANNPLRMGVRLPGARLAEAARYAAILARHRIPYRWGRKVVAAHGDDRVEAVTVGGRTVRCDTLAVGYGFVPAVELPLLLGCATRVDGDRNLVVTVDGRQETSVPGVFAAGEVTGVGGAELATVEGAIAGAAAAGISTDLVPRREKLRRFAAALHDVFPAPRPEPADGTVICRCEEVHFGRVREALTELGATDARTLKLLTRMGMGWCQGRMCGYTAASLAATAGDREITHEDLAAFANRPIGQPISLGELAGQPGMIE